MYSFAWNDPRGKSSSLKAERARRQAEFQAAENKETATSLTATNAALTANKRKLEGDIQVGTRADRFESLELISLINWRKLSLMEANSLNSTRIY